MKDNFTYLVVKTKGLENSLEESLVHPIISLGKIQFQEETFSFPSLQQMNNLMNHHDGIQNFSVRNKSSFVLGRQILDSIMMVHEVIHSLEAGKREGFFLKLDLSKAYDRVD